MPAPLSLRARAVLTAAVAVFVVGVWMIFDGGRSQAPPLPSTADAFPSPTPSSSAPLAADPGVQALAPSAPRRISIPKVGIDAPISPVDLNAAGQLPAPSSRYRNLAGWYARSATPGSMGEAVIDGHVDTAAGPAVFWNLGALHRGDTVDIIRADRSTAEFTIDAIEVYPKAGFPSDRVFGETGRPELRLLTCGGGYRKRTGYLGNVVVYAHLTRGIPPRADDRDRGT